MADTPSTSPNGPQIAPPLDQLSQLLMNLPRQSSPLAGLTPNAPAMPMLQGSTPDLENRAAQPRQPVVAQPPQPSDDPAITSAQSGMDASAKRLQDQMSAYDVTKGKIAAVPPVNPADYKPKWTDRLFGGLVGAATGFQNPAEGVRIGSDVTNRGLHRAQAQRQSTIAPLLEQLNTEREEIPMLTQANESSWRQFQGAKDTANLNRESARDKDLAQFHDEIAAIREEATKGNMEKANNLLDQKQKELELKQKNGEDISKYRDSLIDLKQQMIDLKEKQGDKPKASQSLAVENKRDAGWGKARREYDAATSKLDPKDTEGMKQAQEDYYEKLQDAQDEYEQGIGVLGGSAKHVTLERNHFGEQPTRGGGSSPAPAAAPSQSGAAPAKATQSASVKSISSQGLQKAANDHFGGDLNKAKAQFLKDNPGATISQ